MSDKPIIFSAPMVRALLDGRKTQTRRVLNPQPPEAPAPRCAPGNTPRHAAPYLDAYCGEKITHANPRGMSRDWHWWQVDDRPGVCVTRVPYAPGDRLYVRENCATWEGGHRDVVYRSDLSDKDWSDLLHDARNGAPWKRRLSIHMPRWASRLTLTVTDVRVQRLQEISEADAVAEGCEPQKFGTARNPMHDSFKLGFSDLWNSLHGPDAWAVNPWVCAISFTVQRGNIDQMGAA